LFRQLVIDVCALVGVNQAHDLAFVVGQLVLVSRMPKKVVDRRAVLCHFPLHPNPPGFGFLFSPPEPRRKRFYKNWHDALDKWKNRIENENRRGRFCVCPLPTKRPVWNAIRAPIDARVAQMDRATGCYPIDGGSNPPTRTPM
jgi:hypothetical protein